MLPTGQTRTRGSHHRAGWLLLLLVVFTLSIGTAVHNHGLFGVDGGAEKLSQSKFTCPACVFDGRPVTFATTAVVVCDSSHVPATIEVERTFETILDDASSSRAPPAV